MSREPWRAANAGAIQGADLYGDLLDDSGPPLSAWRKLLPGLSILAVAALAAAWMAEHYGAPIMLMGLLIGLALNFVGREPGMRPGLDFASQTLLRIGIVLVGTQITWAQIGALGGIGFAIIGGLIVIGIGTGIAAARFTGQDRFFGILSGGAVAICGASAALALAGLLGEKRVDRAQLTFVLVAVAAASALAMTLYPLLADSLALSDRQSGFMIGATIHDVAQALAAGYSISPEAGDTAAIVKLTRVSLLAPTLLILGVMLSRSSEARGSWMCLPWFVLGFLALATVNSFFPFPDPLPDISRTAASTLLLLAVTANAMASPMNLLLRQGWRSAVPVIAATLVILGVGLFGVWVIGG